MTYVSLRGGLGVPTGEEMARMAAAAAQQAAQQKYDQAQQTAQSAEQAAHNAVLGLKSFRLPPIFLPAANAAASVAAKSCPSRGQQTDCNRVAAAIATDTAAAVEARTKKGAGYVLAFPAPEKINTYDLCVAIRTQLDANYALALRYLIDVYYGLWPSEERKAIRPDLKLTLPAFSTIGKDVPARTVSSDLVRAIQARIVANGGRMTTQGRRPSSPSYCVTSGDQLAAAKGLKKTYDSLLESAKLTCAELIGIAVGQRIANQFQRGVTVPEPPPSSVQTEPPPEAAVASNQPAPPVEYEEPGAMPPTYEAAGFGGVPWKWWIIGGVAFVGAAYFLRRKS